MESWDRIKHNLNFPQSNGRNQFLPMMPMSNLVIGNESDESVYVAAVSGGEKIWPKKEKKRGEFTYFRGDA